VGHTGADSGHALAGAGCRPRRAAGWRFKESAFLQQRHDDGASALTSDEVALLDDLPSRSVWQELELMLMGEQMQALEWRRIAMHSAGQLLPAGKEGLGEP
jgi:hypothetical protein